jgi:hypothetical protein
LLTVSARIASMEGLPNDATAGTAPVC